MIIRLDYRPSAYDDDWEDIPASGPARKWLNGVALPLLLIGYAVACFITGHGTLPGRGGWLGGHMHMNLHGPKAVALGVACVSLGVFLHCHYFWGNIYHLSGWAELCKIISLIGLIGGLGYLIVQSFLH